jgi:hypothetical protein
MTYMKNLTLNQRPARRNESTAITEAKIKIRSAIQMMDRTNIAEFNEFIQQFKTELSIVSQNQNHHYE